MGNTFISGHQAYNLALGGYATEIMIGTGSNYLTDPGDTYIASNYVVHPDWDGGVFGNNVDLALLHFEQGVPTMTEMTIADTALGETLNAVGYGRPAAGGSYLPVDGQSRAFELFVDGYGLTGSISTDYVRSVLLPLALRNNPMAGGGTPGHSGGGVLNSQGELSAIMVGEAFAPGIPMTTYSLRLDLHEPWSQTVRIVVPEPSAFVMMSFMALAVACRRR